MAFSTVPAFTDAELYPSSDGQPMAENTVQYRWIVLIKENLERLFADRPDVFIAGDLLWYPVAVAVPPAPCQAPDVMVVLGRPKGDRASYKQFEEGGVPPQVVFEILSESNRTRRGQEDLATKFRFYERYGVEEYYVYDPDRRELKGWQRQGERLLPIAAMGNWLSPHLGVQFAWASGTELQLYFPNGERFLTVLELSAERDWERQRRAQAERQWQQAEQVAIAERVQREQAEQAAIAERVQREQAEQAAIAERVQREQAEQAAIAERVQREQAEQRAAVLAAKLRALGLDP